MLGYYIPVCGAVWRCLLACRHTHCPLSLFSFLLPSSLFPSLACARTRTRLRIDAATHTVPLSLSLSIHVRIISIYIYVYIHVNTYRAQEHGRAYYPVRVYSEGTLARAREAIRRRFDAREYASGPESLLYVWRRDARLCVAGAQERASSPPSGATLHLLLPLSASTSFFYLSARPTHMCMCTLVFSVRSEPAENARYCYIIIIVIVRGDSRRVPTVLSLAAPCVFSTVCCRLQDSPRRGGGEEPSVPRRKFGPRTSEGFEEEGSGANSVDNA